VNRLEELRRAVSQARRDWKWADVARLEAEIVLEEKRLTQVAADLPAADVTMSDDEGPGAPDFEEPLVRLDDTPPPPKLKTKSKKKR